MDAYEATRIVFSRIQSLDPENAPKIMGLLLIQDHGDKEMIRLAFGPEALLHSLVLKARKDLGLIPATTPSTPSPSLSSPFFSRQNSSSGSSCTPSSSPSPRLHGLPLSLTLPSSSSSSWVSNSSPFLHNGVVDLQAAEELISPNSAYGGVNVGSSSSSNSISFFGAGGAGGDLMEELQLQDHLSFLNDPTSVSASAAGLSKMGNTGAGEGDLFYPPESPTSPSEAGMLFQYGNWGTNGHHRRSCSVADVDLIGGGFGWKPCLYFARGYCKNGSSCRFLHGPPDSPTDPGSGKQLDVVEHELLRSKSTQRLVSQLLPPSPTFPFPSANKCMNFLLQQQGQNVDSQRAAVAAAALMLGDESHKFGSRSMMRMERNEFAAGGAGMVNPGSRQIYLTFPADSTFREEDVSNYFSIYGPVQDVRIPYQQKRMFGFVTFVYPETVKLILAKGNPHFVCDARVLVKPYKEKGKVPDKYRKQQQQAERGEFAACSPPATLDSRERYDLQQLGARMLYNNSHEVMLRRKLEEQQADMQQAIELQGRRLMGLQLLDVTRRNLSGTSPLPSPSLDPFAHYDLNPAEGHEGDTCLSAAATLHSSSDQQQRQLQKLHQDPFMPVPDKGNNDSAGEERLQQESNYPENNNVEHNLPDSPFASPTKSLTDPPPLFTCEAAERSSTSSSSSSPPAIGNITTCGNASSGAASIPIASSFFSGTSSLDNMASFKSCFLQMPRFSSGHGAIGM